jgi:hypothetical protein
MYPQPFRQEFLQLSESTPHRNGEQNDNQAMTANLALMLDEFSMLQRRSISCSRRHKTATARSDH